MPKQPWEMTKVIEDKNIRYTAQYSPDSDVIKVNPDELAVLSKYKRYNQPADKTVIAHERLHAFWDKYLPDAQKPALLNSLKAIPQSKGIDPSSPTIGERAVETLTAYEADRQRLSPEEAAWAREVFSKSYPESFIDQYFSEQYFNPPEIIKDEKSLMRPSGDQLKAIHAYYDDMEDGHLDYKRSPRITPKFRKLR